MECPGNLCYLQSLRTDLILWLIVLLYFTLFTQYNISVDDYFGNYLQTVKVSFLDQLRSIRSSVDKSVWLTPPTAVNAYYDPQFNEFGQPASSCYLIARTHCYFSLNFSVLGRYTECAILWCWLASVSSIVVIMSMDICTHWNKPPISRVYFLPPFNDNWLLSISKYSTVIADIWSTELWVLSLVMNSHTDLMIKVLNSERRDSYNISKGLLHGSLVTSLVMTLLNFSYFYCALSAACLASIGDGCWHLKWLKYLSLGKLICTTGPVL